MRLWREEAQHIGYKQNFSVFDGSDSGKIIAELLGSSGRDAVFRAQHRISLWKNDLLTPEQAFQVASNEWERQTAQLYAGYQETLHSYQAVDFDDLILLPTRLLQNEAGIRIKWQMRLLHLLVDECQDTNTCQYTLMKLLTGAEGRFTAVGDDDQSIYAWRGANMENLRLLQQDYPALKIIKLEQNYRSSARILRVANQVIANNPKLFPKTLWSQYGEGEPVRIIACQNEQHEAEYAAGSIIRNRAELRSDTLPNLAKSITNWDHLRVVNRQTTTRPTKKVIAPANATTAPVPAGTVITYQITPYYATVNKPVPGTITVTDILPTGLKYVADSARFDGQQLEPTIQNDKPAKGLTTLTWKLENRTPFLGVHSDAAAQPPLTYKARTSQTLLDGTKLRNDVATSGGEYDAASDCTYEVGKGFGKCVKSAFAEVTVQTPPGFVLEKTSSQTSIKEPSSLGVDPLISVIVTSATFSSLFKDSIILFNIISSM